MINNKKVGKAISILRKKQNLTQKELANKLNVSDKAISKWERGLGLPDISLLSTLSIILDTDMESLLEGNHSYKKDNWIGLIHVDNSNIKNEDLIFDKTVLNYQIGYLMLAGIKDIYIIGECINKRIVKEITKNIRINIIFVNNVKQLPNENIMFINKPLFIYGQSITRSFQKAMERKEGITILSLSEHVDNNIDIIFDSNRRVIDDKKLAIETAYKYNALPVFFFPKAFSSLIDMNSLDIIINDYKTKMILYTEPMFRGIVYIPLNNDEDIEDASKIVEIIQKRDYKIGDLKEIAFRRGL